MPEYSLIIGGAGTGKTTELLRLMSLVTDRGIDPFEVGFFSFTKAARHEAAQRAGDKFGLKPDDLEQAGWFRTVHSVCYRQLAPGKGLLTDDAESKRWLKENLQADVSGVPGDEAEPFAQKTDADCALMIWGYARNTLKTMEAAWHQCRLPEPTLEKCREIVSRYEQAKTLDHRCDFTDLLGRFAGWRFGLDGHTRCSPEGDCPVIRVLFLDEAQDTTLLQHHVLERLTEHSRWVYVVGDPFQSIYRWAGADPTLMRRWPVPESRVRILPQSYRCGPAVHAMGERCLRLASDYWDRGIAPANHSSTVDDEDWRSDWDRDLNPSHSTLLLARTNFQSRRIIRRLDDESIPWIPTKGHGGWNAPVRMKACRAMQVLAEGYAITGDEWQAVLKQIDTTCNGDVLLTRGTKTQWAETKGDALNDVRPLSHLTDWGATPALCTMIADGRWTMLIDKADQYLRAATQWGYEAVLAPKIAVGTIHSAKGAEADNVFILTTTSRQVADGSIDDEARVAYVGVTRARHRLTLLREPTPLTMEGLS